ncbi:hypothetical protein niasHT_015658 [Heterodera trifolii]|uniref:WH2 domain-containing protein n=1 Tax=Heterodera trifolii TaxID=157864 RepID=A0ABD2L499_9BILA
MGPNEEAHKHNSSSIPNRIDSVESDDDEIAGWRAEGWRIGFDVEMRVGVPGGVDRPHESAESESDATEDGHNTAYDAENGPSLNCGYVLLPSSAVDDAPPSPPTSTPTATSPTHCQSNWLVPAPPPATELDSIQHKPNDFNLDRVKTEEIKQIMAQMSVSSRKPEWAQQIDDGKLTELVDRLKKGKVTDGK